MAGCEAMSQGHGGRLSLLTVALHRAPVDGPIVSLTDNLAADILGFKYEDAAGAYKDVIDISMSEHDIIDEVVVV